MAINLGPRPQQGRPSTVEIIDTAGMTYPLQVMPGTYEVQEAQRFGDKISTGELSYQDFNPYESATVSSRFRRGYGLRRYTDWTGDGDPYGFILESSNVDTRHDVAILSDQVVAETLPNATGPVIWMGEVLASNVVQFLAVCAFAGRCIYSRQADGTWIQATAGTTSIPVAGAVGEWNSVLVIGYGSAAVAQYTADGGASIHNVTDSASANIYVFAHTADRAAAYVAGGAAGRPNLGSAEVMAAADGHTFDTTSRVLCGDASVPITGLAPGGGLVTLFVGKATHLAEIDNNNVYRVLVPYQTRWPRNSLGMRWWLARGAVNEGGGDQQGPLVLVVPRDRQLMAYAPSSQTAGQVQNLTPWANPALRPPNVRGETRAMLGTARWLYTAITNGVTGQSWILCRDGQSNATSIYLDLGVTGCQALGYTSSLTTNPLLVIGMGNGVGTVTLPLDSEWPLDDPSTRRALTGWVKLPEIDLGFIGEPKVEFSVQIIADSLTVQQPIQVQYTLEGGALQTLGSATQSPVTEIIFPDPRPSVRWLQLLLNFSTLDRALTPQLRAVVVRASLNAKLYRMWVFQARVPAGAGALPSDDLLNPYTLLAALWNLRRAGVPVIFSDRYGDRAQVRIMELGEKEVIREPDGPLESLLSLKLLEVAGPAAATVTDLFALGTWTTGWFPLTFPYNVFGPEMITGGESLPNIAGADAWPIFVFHGPGKVPTVTNVVTPFGGAEGAAQAWTLDLEILAGETITANFDPSRHTVLDQDGHDRSAHVTIGSAWWSLAPGTNAITVGMRGATPASSIGLVRPA